MRYEIKGDTLPVAVCSLQRFTARPEQCHG